MQYSKNKLNAYRGVLKNKNLAKVMEEGLTAAVGSTKRKRAQKMLSILRKTSVDGQGGPGPRSIPQVNVRLKPRYVDYSNLLILPAAPKIRVNFGEPAPTPKPVHDGKGYSGPMPIPSFQGQSTYATPPPDLMGGLGVLGRGIGSAAAYPFKVGDKYVGQPARNLVWGVASSPFTSPTSRTFDAPQFQTKTSSPLAVNLPPTTNAATAAPKLTWGVAGQGAQIGGRQPGVQYDSPIGPLADQDFLKNLRSGAQSSESFETQDPGMGNFMGPEAPVDPTTAAANGHALNSKFGGVAEAVQNNLGPTMFAHNSLKEEGGGMYERLMKIEEATRKSYNLDYMKDQLDSMIVSGGALGDRLTDYVRGRDEFLNETEGLISDLKTRTMKMDMSDPRTKANVQQHANYLYEMRGRQSKRYVEFMNTSLETYKASIEGAKAVYDTEFARYENDVLNQQNIAKEDYQMMFTGLQEMYNTVAGAEQKAKEAQLMEYQLIAARASSIRDVMAVEGTNSGDIDALNKSLQGLNILGSNGEWKINNNALTLSGANVSRLAELMDEGVARAMTRTDKDGNVFPVSAGEAKQIVQNALGHLSQLQSANIIAGDEYVRRETSLRNHLARYYEGNNEFLPTTSIPAYRKAVESLAGDGWISNRSTPSRDKFLSKYGPGGEGLDPEVLNTIYSNLLGYTDKGLPAREFVDTFFSSAGELGQPGEGITSDGLIRRKMLADYLDTLEPSQIVGNISFNKVGGGTNSASIAKAAQAIKNIESSGGNYKALGKILPSGQYAGDRAYGAYQVMGKNIPSWTQQALGYSMTPAQFLNNPQAQDAVFAYFFGNAIQEHGTVEDAASVWFSGRPVARAGNAQDALGTSVPSYVRQFQASYYG